MALGDTGNSSVGGDRKFKRGMVVVGSAEMIYQLTGSNMSSPQTAELNAGARAPTISKWVQITHWEAVIWVGFLCWLFGNFWPVVGGGLAWSGMYAKYRHAIVSGLNSHEPPTENYKFNGATSDRAKARAR